jgi:predicted alpha/beta superfamily hydrolase
VLYLNDGQNVFADPRSPRAKWRADEVAADLIAAGEIVPIAIVAIDHGGARRFAEYLPYPDPRNARAKRFEADRYADLLVRRLIPRVRLAHPELAGARHAGLGGSSYGAIAALHTAARHPAVFDRLLIESAPLWVGDGRLIPEAAASLRRVRAWVGVGTSESSRPVVGRELVALSRRLARAVDGRRGSRVRLRVARGARHHEDAWAARLPEALRFLFGS